MSVVQFFCLLDLLVISQIPRNRRYLREYGILVRGSVTTDIVVVAEAVLVEDVLWRIDLLALARNCNIWRCICSVLALLVRLGPEESTRLPPELIDPTGLVLRRSYTSHVSKRF